MDIRLTVEILAPTSQVGRIIGKGGANVRELQRLTNAMIKLPEQGTSTGEETPVHINGNFYSVQVLYNFSKITECFRNSVLAKLDFIVPKHLG
jgi:insulin-like growth factor 2 mRNA-binding protein 1